MAGMTCTCGAELSNHEVPNDIQLRVYTDREWYEIFDCNIVLKQQKRGSNQGWDTIRKIFIKMWGDSNGG